jgi:predicted ester cyclase
VTIENNKALYRRFIQEAFNSERLDIVDELLLPDYLNHDAPAVSSGREGVKQIISMVRAAFADLQITIEDLVAEGDLICAPTTTRGTHQGPLFGIAASAIPEGRSTR